VTDTVIELRDTMIGGADEPTAELADRAATLITAHFQLRDALLRLDIGRKRAAEVAEAPGDELPSLTRRLTGARPVTAQSAHNCGYEKQRDSVQCPPGVTHPPI
jgi:hypothetical protein